jgi:CDP-diacylglycerol--serine O-phosphatidyltransferase
MTIHAIGHSLEKERWKGYLPTWVTLGNGACGVLAIIQIGIGLALQEGEDLHTARHFHMAAWLVLAGMAFDGLDGFVARALRKTSPYGAILDSLCDLLSFGVAPAFLVFAIAWRPELLAQRWHERLLLATAVTYALCALVRLARFTSNTAPDEDSHRTFRGLPSPAAAGVVVGSILISRLLSMEQVSPAGGWFRTTLLAVTTISALLMVSTIPYPHLINRYLKKARPLVLAAVGTAVLAAIVAFGGVVISFSFLAYALSGVIIWVFSFARDVPTQ